MIKKVIWICVIVLLATTIYTVGLPSIKFKKEPIRDPKIESAVLYYANHQMPRKTISVPHKAVSWQVEGVLILALEDMPGPHGKRRIECKLTGGYQLPGDFGVAGPSRSFSQKNTFIISDKYPEGISVQYEK